MGGGGDGVLRLSRELLAELSEVRKIFEIHTNIYKYKY